MDRDRSTDGKKGSQRDRYILTPRQRERERDGRQTKRDRQTDGENHYDLSSGVQ